MYVIATDSRRKDEVLFMVNRSRQRASFWSNRLDDAMRYGDKNAAMKKAASLRFNRPRVMPLHAALNVAEKQAQENEIDDFDPSWDAHKGQF